MTLTINLGINLQGHTGGGGGAPSVLSSYDVTMGAGQVSANISDFEMQVQLADMPSDFWNDVSSDGGNIRVYAADGATLVPHDVVYVDAVKGVGKVSFKADLTTGGGLVAVIKCLSSGSALPVDDSNGRNALWADYRLVLQGSSTDNRTGESLVSDFTDAVPNSMWARRYSHTFTGLPHQGVAVDRDVQGERLITIDTNYLRRHTKHDMDTVVASNADPLGDINISGVNHLGDGCIVGDELIIAADAYPENGGDKQYMAVFDADTLAFKRATSIAGSFGVAGICFDGTYFWTCDYYDDNSIHRVSADGTTYTQIALSETIGNPQGIEYVDGSLYISAHLDGRIFKVATDGASDGALLYRSSPSRFGEGLSVSGGVLWALDADGKCDIFIDGPASYFATGLSAQIEIPDYTTTWAMGASVTLDETSPIPQFGFLTYGDTGATLSRTAANLFDAGPNDVGLYSGASGWLKSGVGVGNKGPLTTITYHNGTTERGLVVNGDIFTAASPPALPNPASGDAILHINLPNTESGAAYYDEVFLRDDVPSDAFLEAKHNNLHVKGFYTVS